MSTEREVSGPPNTRFLRVVIVPETGSTNRDLLEAGSEGAPEGRVLVTDHQTAGRGRQGRAWIDEPESSLLTSVLLRPDASWAPLIPLATGLAIVRAIQQTSGATVGLKWPNDVMASTGGDPGVGGSERKLAGILAEADTRGGGLVVVVGFGVNLAWAAGAPTEVAAKAVDLASISGVTVDRIALLRSILTELDGLLVQLEGGAVDEVLDAYRSVCLTLGRRVRMEAPGGEVEGEAVAIDASGGLSIDTGARVVTVTAGEAHHIQR